MLDHFVWSAKTQSYKRDTQLKNRCYVIKAIAMFQFTKIAEYKKNSEVSKGIELNLKKNLCLELSCKQKNVGL